jgi:hypothetical protein
MLQCRCQLLARTGLPTALGNVRYQVQSGTHMLAASISPFDPKRSSATHSRLHFGRPEPWEGRLAALLVSRDVLTKAQMSAGGDKLKFPAQSVHYRL